MSDLYKPTQHPLLIVISGPSGVGKDTIARKLIAQRPDSFYFVVTATTRLPRNGEVEGVDYFFVTNNEFAQMINEDELLEYAIVYNDYKGVPKQQIRDALASGKDVIMRLDVQGAATIRNLIPNAVSIFLITQSEDDLVKRLQERKSETAEGLQLRIAMARKEIAWLNKFKYVVINADEAQDTAVQRIMSIIDAEKSRVDQTAVVL